MSWDLPSRTMISRSAYAATRASWVTSTTAVPCPGPRRPAAHHPLAVEGVQRAGRLVGEDHPRPGDQRAGHRDALALTAGDLAGPLARDPSDLQPLQPFPGARARPPAPGAGQPQRQGHVLQAGQLGDELAELEDEAEVGAAQRAALGVRMAVSSRPP